MYNKNGFHLSLVTKFLILSYTFYRCDGKLAAEVNSTLRADRLRHQTIPNDTEIICFATTPSLAHPTLTLLPALLTNSRSNHIACAFTIDFRLIKAIRPFLLHLAASVARNCRAQLLVEALSSCNSAQIVLLMDPVSSSTIPFKVGAGNVDNAGL